MLIITFALIPGGSKAQRPSYAKEMQQHYASIQKHFYLPEENLYKENAGPLPQQGNKYAYLWPLCAMFEATQEMGRVTGIYAGFDSLLPALNKYYTDSKPAPGFASYLTSAGFSDLFYDDNQWIGITAMDAYERTGDKKWMDVGQTIYRFMMTGFDTVSGGGIYWKEHDLSTKNTCSNGPGILLALQLYKATKQKPFLDTAIQLYEWTNKNLRSAQGLYWDNIHTKTGKTDPRRYSYNTGTMLQSNVYLYELTGNKKYLEEAQFIAKNAVQYFYGQEKFRDNYWFNAVLLRGLMHLYKHDKQPENLKAFEKALMNGLENNKNEKGLMGKEKTADLVGQGGMLEILARFAWLQKKGVL